MNEQPSEEKEDASKVTNEKASLPLSNIPIPDSKAQPPNKVHEKKYFSKLLMKLTESKTKVQPIKGKA